MKRHRHFAAVTAPARLVVGKYIRRAERVPPVRLLILYVSAQCSLLLMDECADDGDTCSAGPAHSDYATLYTWRALEKIWLLRHERYDA